MPDTINLIALGEVSTGAIRQIGLKIISKGGKLWAREVFHKSPGDVATQVDRWAEGELKRVLHQALPSSEFLGEETGGVELRNIAAQPTWIVDPIDGTANFSRGYPQWSVSVALAIEGEPVLGIIYDPSRDEMFFALRGHGAWLQTGDNHHSRQSLHCATIMEPLHATVSTVFPKPHSRLMDAYLPEFEAVIRSFGQVRRSGSMALELAYVAAGRADAFWERGMAAWDAAAGIVLLREAGAQIVAMDDLPLLQSQFLAAGSAAMLPLLRSKLNETKATPAKP
jgi:myo-inositol-1(or 4)-monophosphatase